MREKLARLVADDLHAVIDFEMPEPAGSTKAAAAHRRRTAYYKNAQLVALAPDSQAVAQACTYLVLLQLETQGNTAPAFRRFLIDTLIAAGYERGQVECTLDRLAVGVARRRTRWQRGQVRKLSSALAKAIRVLK